MDPELVLVRPCLIERSASIFWSSLIVDPELVFVRPCLIERSASTFWNSLTVDPESRNLKLDRI